LIRSKHLRMMDITSILTEPTTWIAITITLLVYLYRYGTSAFHVFSSQGIPGPKPVPFFGTFWGIWRKSIPDEDLRLVKEYGKLYGTFEGTVPTLHINDTKLIRSIFIKDFDHFINRRHFELPENRLLDYALSNLRDQAWKDVRSAVTPTFTSGKIKKYSVLMKECADKMCQRLHSFAAEQGKVDIKEQMSILTMSIIAKCAFGMTIDKLGEKENPLLEKARRFFSPPENKTASIALVFAMPPKIIGLMFKILYRSNPLQYFSDVVDNMAQERSNSNQKFNDFPEMAAEAISSYTKEENGKIVPMWTKQEVEDIVGAQVVLFMVAGFDTTASTLTSSCFELTRHPEIQEKLYDQIMDKIDKYGDVCHELIQDLPYLDQFMNEVLRMHPPLTQIERQCNKEATYDGIHIPKNMIVAVNTYALHHSEEYYTDPETFDPDRWSAENKANLDPYAFMPFGMGPRNCVAMRFAQEEVKLVLGAFIKQFRFFPVEETPAKLGVVDGFYQIIQLLDTTVGIAARP